MAPRHVRARHEALRRDDRRVASFSLEIEDGEFMVLVGPSGSGKTTALRLLAGLEALTSGTIRIGERVVDAVAPRERDIAMVFQDYALYPQMSVRQNLAFGLKMRKLAASRDPPPRRRDGRAARDRARCSSASRARSRAGSASGSRSAARSCASRRCSSWTSRSRTSTRSCARRRGPRSDGSSARSERRPST